LEPEASHRVPGAMGRVRLQAGFVCVATLAIAACRHAPSPPVPPATAHPATFVWHLPPGIPVPRVPADNPMSDAKVELGRRLFYDTRLSGNGTYACASCHQQALAFTDRRAHAIGSTGALHPRSSMSLANVAYNVTFGWADPALRSLEAQIAVPMFNEHPIELGLKGREAEVVGRLSVGGVGGRDASMFAAAFPGDSPSVTFGNVVKAIAAFERTLVSGDSPFDHYLYRDERSAITPAAKRGMDLFFSKQLRCSECHSGFNLSGPVLSAASDPAEPQFHNTGLYDLDGRGAYPSRDRGLVDKTGTPADMGRFRAPTLRNIVVTAPYMHDGSVATLEAAVAHYARGGVKSVMQSDRIKGFRISRSETADLVEFLKSLTDRTFLTNPAFARPGTGK
jgi:cytochrome c peroxidase